MQSTTPGRRWSTRSVAMALAAAFGIGMAVTAVVQGSKSTTSPSTAAARHATTSTRAATTQPAASGKVPSSRRIWVSFYDALDGHDSMVVRYYSHDKSRLLLFTCTEPHESFSNNVTGFDQTWTSVGACSEKSGHDYYKISARFAVNYDGPDYMYVRLWPTARESYRFVCAGSVRYLGWAPTASVEVRRAGVTPCHVDDSTFAGQQCGSTTPPPTTYDHVVVIMLENRTWAQVGGVGFGAMPYMHAFAQQCTTYLTWLETDANQKSLTQYIGLTSGVDNPATVNDCVPSLVCRSNDDNIFRQVRDHGGRARSFVEDATKHCDGATHRPNVPAMYYYGGADHSFCYEEVLPLTQLNVNNLPTFTMIIPSRCDNGHACSSDVVDAWVKVQVQHILDGASYRAGKTAIFVLYDEDRPMPNLIIAPTAHRGLLRTPVATHSEALRTFEEMLGLPILPSVQNQISLRPSGHI